MDAREIDVSASGLSFDPARIGVAVGEKVAIRLAAGDTLHDRRIDELGLHVSAEAGKKTASGGFAETPGESRITARSSATGPRAWRASW